MKILFLLSTLLFSSAHAAVAESHYKWNKKNIVTCWMEGEMDISSYSEYHQIRLAPAINERTTILPRTKSRLMDLINREFTPIKTGIHFTGWQSCDQTRNPDLKIIPINSNATALGRAPIGRSFTSDNLENGGFLRGASYLYLNFRADRSGALITPFEDIETTFLHEMGHVAGLRHEHVHPDAKTDPNCHANNLREGMSTRSDVLSTYDPNSIMNYCFLDTVGHNSVVDRLASILWISPERISHWEDRSIFQLISHSWSAGSPETNLVDHHRDRRTYKVKIALSRGDLHGLKCLYVYNQQQQRRNCHPETRVN